MISLFAPEPHTSCQMSNRKFLTCSICYDLSYFKEVLYEKNAKGYFGGSLHNFVN